MDLLSRSVTPGESPPPPPRACFGRTELIEQDIGFATINPVTPIGACVAVNTSVALTALYHNRIKDRFGGVLESTQFCVVTQWMKNGNILEHLAKHPNANRLELVCLMCGHQQSGSALTEFQLIGVTRGLDYLHHNGIVHGNLKTVSGIGAVVLLG